MGEEGREVGGANFIKNVLGDDSIISKGNPIVHHSPQVWGMVNFSEGVLRYVRECLSLRKRGMGRGEGRRREGRGEEGRGEGGGEARSGSPPY